MKKQVGYLLTAASLVLTLSTPAFAHNGNYHLNLNGVNVDSQPGAEVHMMPNGYLYTSVETFTKYYGASYTWDEKTKTLAVNTKTVTSNYGAAHMHEGRLCAPVRALVETIGVDNGQSHYAIGYDNEAMQANVTIMPVGVVQLTPSIPQMGEHWADPKNMPLGPIYGVSNGKLDFLEYMPPKDLDKTVHDVPGNTVPIPPNINHMDIDWNPNGHQGFEVPHYDIHLYFIDREEQNKIPGALPPAPAAAPVQDATHGDMPNMDHGAHS